MYRLAITLISCLLLKTCYVAGDTNYRLNSNIRPIEYHITITPYFDTSDDKAFTFDGEVSINLRTYEDAIKQIKIHSEDLQYNISDVTLTLAGQSIVLDATNGLEFDKNYSFAYINVQEQLLNNTEYTLNIKYTANLRTDLNGFYRSFYVQDGVKKWLGATQMEPTHTRKVFPCFDEPEYKATFYMTIDRPQNYKPSLSNMEIMSTETLSSGYIREMFYPTPIMSTYLIAFLVSEFEAASQNITETHEFGVYSRPEAVNQSTFAFEFGQKVEKALSQYFGIDYYSSDAHLRLDHVALPDFRAGAMENWGLIKYREAYLLYDPEVTSPDYKYRIAQIIAHETTHMWFGNLVTCHWWSNTWLNEGFANYFQDYITSFIEPDVGSANILVTGSVYSALDADEIADAPPLTNDDVNSPAEISGHFGTISYQKGGSVIRMMHNLLGNDAFQAGLHSYLETNKFNVGDPSKMYEALEQGANSVGSFDYEGISVTNTMKSWVSQSGHPVLNVDINYSDEIVTLTQKRFYADPNLESNETYYIPITYTIELNSDFENTKPAFIMVNRTHEFRITNISQTHAWVIFNIQETGLYRVNYDAHSWQMIASLLKGNKREEIHHLNRAKIVNDLFALLYAEEVEFNTIYEVLSFLKDEDHYSVWFAAIRGLNRVINSYLGTDIVKDIEAYSLESMKNVIEKLGFEVANNESTETQRNRMQLLEFACKYGHQECIDKSVALFKALKENNTEITPSLRPLAYCNGLRYGSAEDYTFLWSRLTTTNFANEARNIITALGCTADETKLKEYLVSITSDGPIRLQDATLPLSSVLSYYDNAQIVINYLKQNYTLWSATYSSMDTVFSSVASSLHKDEDFRSFEEFLDGCTECDSQVVARARASLEKARTASAWAEKHKSDIANVLNDNNRATLFVVSYTLLLLSSIFIVLF